MSHLNVEIKARCDDLDRAGHILSQMQAEFKGLDRQLDTYFHVPQGRLKLRQGQIETALIHYDRPDQPGPKPAQVHLYHPAEAESLKELLTAALGVWITVEKRREIWFVGNIKIHLDRLDKLGTFVEIEAIDVDNTLGYDHLLAQCHKMIDRLGINPDSLCESSYSDMLEE